MNAASARSVAVAVVTSLALTAVLAGCGGGGSQRTDTAGGKPSQSSQPAGASTGQTESGGAASPAPVQGSKRTRRAVVQVCRRLHGPLPPLPPDNRGAE